ncbi:MAG: hypothetical protein NW202_01430 [Nitrospira sp.]|nr:hypothetical protein [Nitrospira sp.]
MPLQTQQRLRIGCGLLCGVLVAESAIGQTFNSGSNGSLGAFAPAANTTITLPPDGILNYTTVNIPAGVTVSFTPNAANTPVTMLATGDVVIGGTVTVNGVNGSTKDNFPPAPILHVGGRGGPGGFAGGQSGMAGLTNNAASGGYGPGGGAPGVDGSTVQGGTYGAPSTFVSLIPLFGGSGGGGTNGNNTGGVGGTPLTGGSGGGGGGAIVVASTTKITVSGAVTANGGGPNFCGPATIGHGSGGAIRLVAPEVAIPGSLQARGLAFGVCTAGGGPGRIRIETLVPGPMVSIDPAASMVIGSLGPVTPNSVPALVNLPTLTISSVGGIATPAVPAGSYTTADVTLPAGTTNPVPVVLTVTNTPVPTTFTVRMVPQFANPVSTTATSSGALALSTATASVTLPTGRISGLQAYAGFTLTASLAPIIDGELADQVLLAAGYGEPSTLTLVTKSGREVPVAELSHDDQVKVAAAFDALQARTQGSKEAAR